MSEVAGLASAGPALAERIVAFLREIGLSVEAGTTPAGTVMPGIEVRGGTLVYDAAALRYPGDLLHEAGHLALMSADERANASAKFDVDGGAEYAASAWSYAALRHLDLEPSVVFHPAGYHGRAQMWIDMFASGGMVGVPILQWRGLAARADAPGPQYPKMIRWLRE